MQQLNQIKNGFLIAKFDIRPDRKRLISSSKTFSRTFALKFQRFKNDKHESAPLFWGQVSNGQRAESFSSLKPEPAETDGY